MTMVAAQSQVPLIESENNTCPLPTPINVRRLEETLINHPDQEFVSKLCNNLRYGADVGFTGRRVARFSRNLPTTLSQPNIVSENLSREVALGRVAGLPCFGYDKLFVLPGDHTRSTDCYERYVQCPPSLLSGVSRQLLGDTFN